MTDPAQPKKATKSGSENRRTSARAVLKCTPAEREEIDGRADRAGLSVSGYLRSLVWGKDTPQPRAARRPPVEKQELVRLQYELRKIGGNINQIAHCLNRGEETPPILDAVFAEHIAAARAIVAALGQKVED